MPGLTMPGLAITAAVTPDNTPHGYDLTFAVPVAVFAVVAIALYLMFRRPHRRIPARQGWSPRTAAPDPDVARAAAIAGGLAIAAGGGATESHLEPAGPTYAAQPGTEGSAEARTEGSAEPGTEGSAEPGPESAEPPSEDGPEPDGTEDGR
jgi:hypothetical protein